MASHSQRRSLPELLPRRRCCRREFRVLFAGEDPAPPSQLRPQARRTELCVIPHQQLTDRRLLGSELLPRQSQTARDQASPNLPLKRFGVFSRFSHALMSITKCLSWNMFPITISVVFSSVVFSSAVCRGSIMTPSMCKPFVYQKNEGSYCLCLRSSDLQVSCVTEQPLAPKVVSFWCQRRVALCCQVHRILTHPLNALPAHHWLDSRLKHVDRPRHHAEQAVQSLCQDTCRPTVITTPLIFVTPDQSRPASSDC